MSKRHKHQGKSFPWPLIVFGGILLITAAFFFARQSSGNNNNGSGTPVIAADPQKIDYGYVKLGTDETFSIKVTNNGDGILRFTDKPYIEVLEGC